MPKYLIFCFFFMLSCSSPQDSAGDQTTKTHVVESKVDFSKLLEEVQTLRDLEFEKAPTLSRVDNIDESVPKELVSEYTSIKRIFDVDLFPPTYARYNKEKNQIEYQSRAQALDEFAVFQALVSALDSSQPKDLQTPVALDAFLASQAGAKSSGAFLSALRELKTKLPELSADRIAKRPQSWLKSEILADKLVNDVSFRNALVFGATTFRSNGIPGLEYGISNGPADSGAIKRPDRWLAGEGMGEWTLSKSTLPEQYKIEHQGVVGPILLEHWLGANPALSFWLGDSYRMFGAKSDWSFEWVSIWETPTAASVAAKMLKEKFESTKDSKAFFSVVEFGNKVSVVGTSSTDMNNADRAQELVTKSQVVFLSVEKPFLNFVPTSLDHLQTLKPQRKGLSAPGLVLEEKILDAWKVERPKSGLWWYATLGKEAIIQCNVELKSLEAPYLSDANYGEKWLAVLQSSVGEVESAEAKSMDWKGKSAWEIDMKGKRSAADTTRRIISRQYANGEFVVSISLVADPKNEVAVQTFKKLVQSASFSSP